MTTADTSGAPLAGEFLPSGGTITVVSYGLTPATLYSFQDSALAGSIGAAYENGYANLKVVLGSFDTLSGEFLAASNGTLVFSYAPLYALLPVPPTTGTVSSVSIGRLAIDTYLTVGLPTLGPSAFSAYAGGASVTFSVSGLIPTGSAIYAGVPVISTYYTLYLEGSPIAGTGSSSCLPSSPTTCFAPRGSLVITFTTPHTTGLEEFAIAYLGASPSSALAQVPILISVPGATVNSGTLTVATNPSTGALTAIGAGLIATASVYDLNVSTSLGVVTLSVTVGASTGAFVQSLAAFTVEPAGTYGLYLFITTASGGSATLFASYSVSAALTITSPASAQGPIGSAVSAAATGLAASAYYDVYFGSNYLKTVPSSTTGSANVAVTVPLVSPGVYTLAFDPAGSHRVAVSTEFTVTASATLTLFTGGTDQSFAFPGELLAYAWAPVLTPPNGTFAPVEVTVYLNGTPYVTSPGAFAGGSIRGSFAMPNSCSGSATSCAGTYWLVTLGWQQTNVSKGNSYTSSYVEPNSGASFLQLVEGNGALLTGISAEQIAEITTAINQTLGVPIAELHAAVVSINDGLVNLTTAFGKMTTTLNAINATVGTLNANVTTGFGTVTLALAEVENGIVVIDSSIGSVNASLNALGARITSIEGSLASVNATVISVQTVLGVVNTTLKAVDATVTSTATSVSGLVGSVATIQTTLGTITGQITSVQNGVATIQTQLGTLETNITNVKTSVSNAQNSLETALYWEIAAVILLIVTLALTAVLLGQARRPPRSPAPPSGWKATPPPPAQE